MLDATGAVTDVEVVEPQGEPFDSAATTALRAAIFEPARRDGAPVPARFSFLAVFESPAAAPPAPLPEPEPEPAYLPTVTFEGEVLDAGEVPIEAAAVTVSSDDLAEPIVAVADAEGHFYFLDLPPGSYRVRVSAPMFATLEAEEEVHEGEATVVRYRLEHRGDAFETVVRAQRPPREVTRRTIETREIRLMPGSGGDALRADKTFDWDVFKLSIYLDVQNVYYQQNVEAFSYNYDFTQRTDVTGLPILPSLGIKGQF
jgi:TonB family protein